MTVQFTRDIYPQFKIGRHTYGHPTLVGLNKPGSADLEIGAFCSIADKVTIFLGCEHRTDFVSTYPFQILWPAANYYGLTGHPANKGPVRIGNDVWIGWGATIMSGVTIGDGAVIGAQSMVTKDVEPYAIVAGNPARFIKFRFSPQVKARLLQSKWWDLTDPEIVKILPILCAPPREERGRLSCKSKHPPHRELP